MMEIKKDIKNFENYIKSLNKFLIKFPVKTKNRKFKWQLKKKK